jgi:hypothetical protein
MPRWQSNHDVLPLPEYLFVPVTGSSSVLLTSGKQDPERQVCPLSLWLHSPRFISSYSPTPTPLQTHNSICVLGKVGRDSNRSLLTLAFLYRCASEGIHFLLNAMLCYKVSGTHLPSTHQGWVQSPAPIKNKIHCCAYLTGSQEGLDKTCVNMIYI